MQDRRPPEDDPTIDVEPESNWVPAVTVLSGNMKGTRIEVKGGEFTIGRSSGNDLVIRDKAASRRHATIKFLDGQYSIRDLGSRWGIKLRGEKVAEAQLKFGDEFEIAGIRMSFGRELKLTLSEPAKPPKTRIAIIAVAFVLVIVAGALIYLRYESRKILDRPGGDVVSQIIFHYDKGIAHYNNIHIDPGDRQKAIDEMKVVIELDPEGTTQFSRSARRIIDGLEK
jgi:hypothetical protein